MFYSFRCDFLTRYVNGCPESKILSIKYPYLHLLIQTSQFYMASWHKLLKSKQFFFEHNFSLNENFRCWSSKYLCNHGFLLCEKFQCVKFEHAEVIRKKNLFSVELKTLCMPRCATQLCSNVSQCIVCINESYISTVPVFPN